MKRAMVDPADLVGVKEMAERLGVPRSQVTTWISRREPTVENGRVTRQPNGFPEPVQQLGMGGVYLWSEVVAWHNVGHGRRVRDDAA